MYTGVIDGAPNFTYDELIWSVTALNRGIDNRPHTETIWRNLEYLARVVLQPVRDYFEQPVTVTSGYRSFALNKAIHGSPTSHHIYGCAADIRVANTKCQAVFSYIYKTLPFTELIAESLGGHPWIHVAIVSGRENEKAVKYQEVGGPVRRSDYNTIMLMAW